jgi:hypothetical protein
METVLETDRKPGWTKAERKCDREEEKEKKVERKNTKAQQQGNDTEI